MERADASGSLIVLLCWGHVVLSQPLALCYQLDQHRGTHAPIQTADEDEKLPLICYLHDTYPIQSLSLIHI